VTGMTAQLDIFADVDEDAALDAQNDAEEAAWGTVRCEFGHTLRTPPGSAVPLEEQRCWCRAALDPSTATPGRGGGA